MVAFLPSFAVVMGAARSTDSGANHAHEVVAAAGVIYPGTFAVSLIGVWIAYALHARRGVIGFACLPWVYLLILVVAFGLVMEGA